MEKSKFAHDSKELKTNTHKKDSFFRFLFGTDKRRALELYNGESKGWNDEMIKIRLSDMFGEPASEDEAGDFEWTATVININPGKNMKIKDRSTTLSGYCYFIELIRTLKNVYSEDEAVDIAVQKCIDEGVLADIFREHRSETNY